MFTYNVIIVPRDGIDELLVDASTREEAKSKAEGLGYSVTGCNSYDHDFIY